MQERGQQLPSRGKAGRRKAEGPGRARCAWRQKTGGGDQSALDAGKSLPDDARLNRGRTMADGGFEDMIAERAERFATGALS